MSENMPRWGKAGTFREFGVIEDRTDKGLGKRLVKTHRHLDTALADTDGVSTYVMHRLVSYGEWMHLGDLENETADE